MNEKEINDLYEYFTEAYRGGQELGMGSPETIAKLVIQRMNLPNMNMPKKINLEIKVYSKELLDSFKNINILLLKSLQNKDNHFTESERKKFNGVQKKINKTIHDVENGGMSIGKLLMSKIESDNPEDIAKAFKEIVESRLKAKEEAPLSSNRTLANEIESFRNILPELKRYDKNNNIEEALVSAEDVVDRIKGSITNRVRYR